MKKLIAEAMILEIVMTEINIQLMLLIEIVMKEVSLSERQLIQKESILEKMMNTAIRIETEELMEETMETVIETIEMMMETIKIVKEKIILMRDNAEMELNYGDYQVDNQKIG